MPEKTFFVVDVYRTYSYGCHIYHYCIILIFKPIRIIKKHFILLINSRLMPDTVLNLGNTNLIGSRETHSQGDLIAPMFKKNSKQLQKRNKAIIIPVPACVTRKQLDLKHNKYTHIWNQVFLFLLGSNLAS